MFGIARPNPTLRANDIQDGRKDEAIVAGRASGANCIQNGRHNEASIATIIKHLTSTEEDSCLNQEEIEGRHICKSYDSRNVKRFAKEYPATNFLNQSGPDFEN